MCRCVAVSLCRCVACVAVSHCRSSNFQEVHFWGSSIDSIDGRRSIDSSDGEVQSIQATVDVQSIQATVEVQSIQATVKFDRFKRRKFDRFKRRQCRIDVDSSSLCRCVACVACVASVAVSHCVTCRTVHCHTAGIVIAGTVPQFK